MINKKLLEKGYDFSLTESGFIAVKNKRTGEVKVPLPSVENTLYFMFDEEFNRDTVSELVRSGKVIKMTCIDFYRDMLTLKQFKRSLDEALKIILKKD